MFRIGLVVDSSPETLVAAQFAIRLAASNDKRLSAYSFIDERKVLAATGFSGAGLCGSGVFLEGYEQMVKVMVSISESLMEALRSRAEGSGVSVEEHISVADPLQLIADTRRPNSLIVLGGHASNFRLAELIFTEMRCPVVVFEPHPDGDHLPRLTLLMNQTRDMEQLVESLERLPGEMQLILPERQTRVFAGNPFYSDRCVA